LSRLKPLAPSRILVAFGADGGRLNGMKNERREAGWIYGVHSVEAVLAARPKAVKAMAAHEAGPGYKPGAPLGPHATLVARARALGIEVRDASMRELTAMTGSDSHQGIAVSAALPPYAELEDVMARPPYAIVALDSITDPQNLGAIVRTAEALGASGLVVPKDRAAGMSAVAHKASAGALEFLPVAQVVNLARALRQIKDDGYWIYGADPRGDQGLDAVDFAAKVVLVIGAEGRGVRPGIDKEIDVRVRIGLAGKTASLNAGVACAILLHEILGSQARRP
jgi:23S rRNA (guanosine2251-2'-O)-methyltransferase